MTTPPPTAAPPIDRPSLVARCMDDADFTCMILGKFGAQLGEMVARIEAAAGDAAAAGRAAHALKGAAANLSAGSLTAVAGAIEAAGHAGDAAGVAAHLSDLRREADRCLTYVPVLRAELSRAA